MIYGIGTMYGSTDEMLPDFITSGAVWIGWPQEEAPALHQLLGQIGVGDIVFAKSFPPSSGLYIKGVAVVTSAQTVKLTKLGVGREVRWIWTASDGRQSVHVGRLDDRYDNMRGGTLYQELGPVVQKKVLDILFNPGQFK
jgi:hypothetical protein